MTRGQEVGYITPGAPRPKQRDIFTHRTGFLYILKKLALTFPMIFKVLKLNCFICSEGFRGGNDTMDTELAYALKIGSWLWYGFYRMRRNGVYSAVVDQAKRASRGSRSDP